MNTSEQSIGVFTTDTDLIIRSWDPCLERQTAISAGVAIGQSLTSLIPDLKSRGLFERFERVLTEGVVEILAPAFHHYLIPCAPQSPAKHFDRMQQKVTIAPLREGERIVGALVTLLDVTARLDRERELAGQLASPDEATRLHAAQALATEDVIDNEPGLVGALGDESWRVRQAAVSGLAKKAEPDTIASLLKLLREEHHNLSILNSALQVLALSDVDVVSPLAEFLRDPDVNLRIQAALALGEQRDPRAVPSLLMALKDSDANVRYHVIEALGKIRAAEAVDALLAVAESGDFFLAFPAIDALMRIGDGRAAPRLAPLLGDEFLRGPAADALGRLGDEEVVAPLIALLNQPNAPGLVIAQSLAALYHRYEDSYQEGSHIADLSRGMITATGTQNLIDALEEAANGDQLRPLALALGWLEGPEVERALTRLIGHPAARKEVIEAFVRYGPRVTDLLIEQLNSEDLGARKDAVIALGRIGDRRAAPALVRVLNTEKDLIIETAGALARIGDSRAFEALLGLIGDPAAGVRQAAISAINSLGHPEMAGRSVTLLNHSNPHVRESAVKIAGYFGYAECVDLLLERCRDADENVRRAAVEHLPYMDDDRVIPVLNDALQNGTPKVRAAAAQAFGQIEGARALQGLLAAVDDADSWVRYFAARSIGQGGFTEATEALARLANKDAAGHVRIAALEALGRLGGPRAVAIIAPIAESDGPDIACAALNALGSIGHPDSLAPLQAALRSTEPARRMAALSALAKRGGVGAVEEVKWVAAADEDAQISRMAIEALARLATPDAIEALIELTVVSARRKDCVNALAQLDSGQIERVARGLNHPDEAVRRAVVEALGRMKQPAATGRLSTALADEAAAVRLAAVHALGLLGSRHSEHKLVAIARTDPDMAVRRAAEKAMRK